MDKLPRDTKIEFSQLDGMYLASGCYKFHIGIENVDKIKELIREDVSCNKKKLTFNLKDLELKFPQITEFYDKKIFNMQGDSSKYFEYFGDITQEGILRDNCSHNVKLYREALEKAKNSKITEEILLQFLETFEGCAVKVVDLKYDKIWGFGGMYENLPIDKNYFNRRFKGSRYALTHGSSQDGFIIIKTLSREEFKNYRNWFSEIQHMQNNPFVPLKSQLEKILRSNFAHIK